MAEEFTTCPVCEGPLEPGTLHSAAGAIDVDVLREAIQVVSVRHRWADVTDTEDRTEEIVAEYRALLRG